MADRIIVACTLLLAAIYLYGTSLIKVPQLGDPLGPRVFPTLITIGLVLAAGLLSFEIYRARPSRKKSTAVSIDEGDDAHHYGVVCAAVIATTLYFCSFEWLGYALATFIYLAVLTSFFHRGSWKTNFASSLLFSFGSYFLFTEILGVRLPSGFLPL